MRRLGVAGSLTASGTNAAPASTTKSTLVPAKVRQWLLALVPCARSTLKGLESVALGVHPSEM